MSIEHYLALPTDQIDLVFAKEVLAFLGGPENTSRDELRCADTLVQRCTPDADLRRMVDRALRAHWFEVRSMYRVTGACAEEVGSALLGRGGALILEDGSLVDVHAPGSPPRAPREARLGDASIPSSLESLLERPWRHYEVIGRWAPKLSFAALTARIPAPRPRLSHPSITSDAAIGNVRFVSVAPNRARTSFAYWYQTDVPDEEWRAALAYACALARESGGRVATIDGRTSHDFAPSAPTPREPTPREPAPAPPARAEETPRASLDPRARDVAAALVPALCHAGAMELDGEQELEALIEDVAVLLDRTQRRPIGPALESLLVAHPRVAELFADADVLESIAVATSTQVLGKAPARPGGWV